MVEATPASSGALLTLGSARHQTDSGGGAPSGGARRPEVPTRPRRQALALPHRWAVLAVAMALMALVTELASGPTTRWSPPAATLTGAAPSGRAAARTLIPPDSSTGAPAPPAGTAGVSSGAGGISITALGVNDPPGQAVRTGSAEAGGSSAPTTVGSTSLGPSTPTTAPSTPGGTGASPTSSSSAQASGVAPPTPIAPPVPDTTSYPGNLEYPDDVSAAYPYTAAQSTFTAAATWAGGATLTLTLSCPEGTRSESGTSGLTLTSVDGPGDCTVTLSEPPLATDAVEYTLTITPGAS